MKSLTAANFLELRKGTNIWVGGRFSRVEQRNGTVLGSVANVAVFDSKTEECRKGVAPSPGGKGDDVFDMALYGDDVLIADNFPGPFVLRTHHAHLHSLRVFSESPAILDLFRVRRLSQQYYPSFPEP